MTKQQLSEFISSPTFKAHMDEVKNFTSFTDGELAELAYGVTPFISDDDDKELPIKAKRFFVEDNLSRDDVIYTYYEYCSDNKYETWEDNDEAFFKNAFGDDAYGAVKAVCRGEYSLHDRYVRFDGYGNLESAEALQVYDEAMDENEFVSYAFEDSNDSRLQSIWEAEIDILELAQWLIGMGYRKTEGED